jgi:hypothetical protein
MLWGFVTDRAGAVATLTASAAWLLVGLPAGLRFHLARGEGTDLKPSQHWPEMATMPGLERNWGRSILPCSTCGQPNTDDALELGAPSFGPTTPRTVATPKYAFREKHRPHYRTQPAWDVCIASRHRLETFTTRRSFGLNVVERPCWPRSIRPKRALEPVGGASQAREEPCRGPPRVWCGPTRGSGILPPILQKSSCRMCVVRPHCRAPRRVQIKVGLFRGTCIGRGAGFRLGDRIANPPGVLA